LLAGDIDMGHARAVLALEAAQQILIANEVIARGLSVRETEKLVNRAIREADDQASRPPRAARPLNGDAKRLEQALSDHLGTRVTLKAGARNRGQLIIDFHDWEHLNALLERQGLSTVVDA